MKHEYMYPKVTPLRRAGEAVVPMGPPAASAEAGSGQCQAPAVVQAAVPASLAGVALPAAELR